jgi:hypothetical protein
MATRQGVDSASSCNDEEGKELSISLSDNAAKTKEPLRNASKETSKTKTKLVAIGVLNENS